MNMTHYMALLAENQPWNLILFMAIPVILAETVAITELFILFSRQYHGKIRQINRFASITGGIYFCGVFIYLMIILKDTMSEIICFSFTHRRANRQKRSTTLQSARTYRRANR